MFKILMMQLHKSTKLILFLTLIFLCSAIGLLLFDIPILILVIFSSSYLLIFLLSVAMGTAFHESSHFSILHDLGFEVNNITVHRIGDVSFHIIDMDKLTPEEGYHVAKAPFVRRGQYILDSSLLTVLIILNLYSPFPINLVLGFFTLLSAFSIIANICIYIVIRKKKYSGLIIGIARTTSVGDIDEIVSWNKSQNESGSVS